MPRTLSELQILLKKQYLKNSTIERLFYPENPLSLEKCFLALALIEEAKASKPEETKTVTAKGEQTLSGREYLLQEYERIPTVSRTVAMTELVTLSQEPRKRLYIEGAAGAGKSTLTRYLAYHYAKEVSSIEAETPTRKGLWSYLSGFLFNSDEQKINTHFLQQYQCVF